MVDFKSPTTRTIKIWDQLDKLWTRQNRTYQEELQRSREREEKKNRNVGGHMVNQFLQSILGFDSIPNIANLVLGPNIVPLHQQPQQQPPQQIVDAAGNRF